jgi:DNA (cytosine-5)-methyltransferase 3A
MEDKNILSLFDGMSCAQQALERSGIKYDNYYASEIDKPAIKVTMANYPNTIQLGSVVDIDTSKLPPIWLLFGGSPCFPSGTKVICQDAIKNIEDVVVGDFVLTHNNRFKEVLKTGGNKEADTIRTSIQGLQKIESTKDHPFLVRSMHRKWDNTKRSSYRFFSEPTWKQAEQLQEGDFVGMPILNNSENPLNITIEEAYIIGRYIADGHTRKDYRTTENRPSHRHWQLILSLGDKKVKHFTGNITENNFSLYSHTQSTHRCIFSSKRLVEIVESHCGCLSKNKHISMTLLSLPKELLTRLIDGYLEGDGHLKKNVHSLNTVSNNLPLCISIAIAKCFSVGSSYSFVKKEKTCVIQGRTVNQSNYHMLRFSKYITKQAHYKVIDGVLWLPVKKDPINDACIKMDVYNLEVHEDNSYTAGGVIVHNCQSFSFAGKRKGMSTKCETEILTLEHYLQLKNEGYEFEGQSYLFWEYMRILKEVKPKYFLLENVEMGAKWEKILSKAIGVNGIHINSSLVSAQNRRRLYWTNIGMQPMGLFGDMETIIKQPKDKGILLKDILESEVDEKYYLSEKALASMFKWEARNKLAGNGFKAEIRGDDEKSASLTTGSMKSTSTYIKIDKKGNVKNNQDKASCFTAGGHSGGNHSDMDLIVCHNTGSTNAIEVRCVASRGRGDNNEQQLEERKDNKTNSLTSVQKDNLVMQLNPSTESNGCQPYQQNRIYDTDGISPALMAQMSCGTHAIQHERKIRRLTPLECELLQTVKDKEIICIFALCLEQAKSYVSAVEQNHKLLKLVLIAEKSELKELVNSVIQSMNASHQLTKLTVPQNVDIQIPKQTKKCINHNLQESNTTVNNAENIAMCNCQKGMVDFAEQDVFINLIEGKITHFGLEELHPKEMFFAKQINGKKQLKLSGLEIMELVKDVGVETINNKDYNSTYTTLFRSNTKSLEQALIIYYLFAKIAIIGYTQNTTSIKNLSLKFKMSDGYTSVASDSQRYRMLGNGWTIDVICHILSYLKY